MPNKRSRISRGYKNKFIGLDGKLYYINLTGCEPLASDETKKSNLHIRARALLKKILPWERINEEVYLPGCSTTLYVDFFILSRRLIVEVQGSQHENYIEFFHKNKLNFFNSKSRDKEKEEWAKLNNFKLVELPYDESDEQWKCRIIESFRNSIGED